MLTDDTARTIGMSTYFPHVRRVFVDILRALDVHYGRPLMMTNTQNQNKEPDEMLTGERKPRIDLFRTCVAAVPRLIPDTMTAQELVDMLSRLTVHMDEELRMLTHQSLQTLVLDFPDWRQDVVHGYTQFLVRDVTDTYPQLLENCTRVLLVFLNIWRCAVGSNNTTIQNNNLKTPTNQVNQAANIAAVNKETISGTTTSSSAQVTVSTSQQQQQPQQSLNPLKIATTNSNSSGSSSINSSGISSMTQTTAVNVADAGTRKNEIPLITTLHYVEGFALVLLCNCRPFLRKLAALILKEVKNLMKALNIPETEPPLIDVIDKCCPQVDIIILS